MERRLPIMKYFILFSIMLLSSLRLFSQDIPCATEVSKEYAEKVKNAMPEFEEFKASFKKNMSASSRITAGLKKNSIPVRICIVRDNAGVTTLDTSLLRKGLVYMNKLFAGSPMNAGDLKIYTDRIVNPGSGLKDAKMDNNCTIYPGVTTGKLWISSPSDVKNVKIFNVQGALQSTYSNVTEIDASGLASGIYLMEVNTTEGKAIRKFIKK